MASGPSEGGTEPRRILVIADRTCPCEPLRDEILSRAQTSGPAAEVFIVAPALNTRIRHIFDDSDAAVAAAMERLTNTVDTLIQAGINATGGVGDADPVQAVKDALHEFPADEILISTHPPGDSHWLERRLLDRTREAFHGSVTHIVSRYGLDAAA